MEYDWLFTSIYIYIYISMYGQGEGVIQGTVLFVLTSEICTSNHSTINFNGMQLIIHADVYLSVSYGMCFIQAGLGRYFISMCIIVYLMIVFPLILTYIGIMSTTNGLIWYLRQTRGGAVIGYSCQSVCLPNSRLRCTLSPFQPSMG